MIGTISPLGKVAPLRAIRCSGLFSIGCTTSAATFGFVLGLMGSWLQAKIGSQAWQWLAWDVVGLITLVCALNALGALPIGLPQMKRQVPQHYWWKMSPERASLAWGAELGLGFTTFITFPVYYVMLACAIASATPSYAAALLAVYGFSRSFPLIATTLASLLGSKHSYDAVGIQWLGLLAKANGLVLTTLALFLLADLFSR